MKSRSKVVLTAVGVLTAGLVASAPIASSAANTKSFAYGFSANGQGQQPYVESTDGQTHETGGAVPPNPLLSGQLVHLSAGDDAAAVNIANIEIGGALAQLPPEAAEGIAQLQQACTGLDQLPPEAELPPIFENIPGGVLETPTADDLAAFCNQLLDSDILNAAELRALNVACDGDTGTVEVAGASVLGAEAPALNGQVGPNTKLLPDESPLQITLNRQTPHDDGSFTVDGLVLTAGPGGEAEVILASTTCGEPIAVRDTDTDTDDPAPAPAPQPVQGDIPVTG